MLGIESALLSEDKDEGEDEQIGDLSLSVCFLTLLQGDRVDLLLSIFERRLDRSQNWTSAEIGVTSHL